MIHPVLRMAFHDPIDQDHPSSFPRTQESGPRLLHPRLYVTVVGTDDRTQRHMEETPGNGSVPETVRTFMDT